MQSTAIVDPVRTSWFHDSQTLNEGSGDGLKREVDRTFGRRSPTPPHPPSVTDPGAISPPDNTDAPSAGLTRTADTTVWSLRSGIAPVGSLPAFAVHETTGASSAVRRSVTVHLTSSPGTLRSVLCGHPTARIRAESDRSFADSRTHSAELPGCAAASDRAFTDRPVARRLTGGTNGAEIPFCVAGHISNFVAVVPRQRPRMDRLRPVA